MDPHAIKNPHIALTPPKLKLSLSTHQRLVPGHPRIHTACKYQYSWVLKSFIENGLEQRIQSTLPIYRFPAVDSKYCFQSIVG